MEKLLYIGLIILFSLSAFFLYKSKGWKKTFGGRRLIIELYGLVLPCLIVHFILDYCVGDFLYTNLLAFFFQGSYLFLFIHYERDANSNAFVYLLDKLRNSWIRYFLPFRWLHSDPNTAVVLISIILVFSFIFTNWVHYIFLPPFLRVFYQNLLIFLFLFFLLFLFLFRDK